MMTEKEDRAAAFNIVKALPLEGLRDRETWAIEQVVQRIVELMDKVRDDALKP